MMRIISLKKKEKKRKAQPGTPKPNTIMLNILRKCFNIHYDSRDLKD